jgi:hypothetical protein
MTGPRSAVRSPQSALGWPRSAVRGLPTPTPRLYQDARNTSATQPARDAARS